MSCSRRQTRKLLQHACADPVSVQRVGHGEGHLGAVAATRVCGRTRRTPRSGRPHSATSEVAGPRRGAEERTDRGRGRADRTPMKPEILALGSTDPAESRAAHRRPGRPPPAGRPSIHPAQRHRLFLREFSSSVAPSSEVRTVLLEICRNQCSSGADASSQFAPLSASAEPGKFAVRGKIPRPPSAIKANCRGLRGACVALHLRLCRTPAFGPEKSRGVHRAQVSSTRSTR